MKESTHYQECRTGSIFENQRFDVSHTNPAGDGGWCRAEHKKSQEAEPGVRAWGLFLLILLLAISLAFLVVFIFAAESLIVSLAITGPGIE